MSRARTPAQRAVVQTANVIKLTRRRGFPAGWAWRGTGQGRRAVPVVAPMATRLFNMRQLDQAVNLIRKRGTAKQRQVLVDAGYAPSKAKR